MHHLSPNACPSECVFHPIHAYCDVSVIQGMPMGMHASPMPCLVQCICHSTHVVCTPYVAQCTPPGKLCHPRHAPCTASGTRCMPSGCIIHPRHAHWHLSSTGLRVVPNARRMECIPQARRSQPWTSSSSGPAPRRSIPAATSCTTHRKVPLAMPVHVLLCPHCCCCWWVQHATGKLLSG